MGDYDKVIKENVEAILIALGKKLLGFEIKNPLDLPEKFQTTIEREPDFLKKVTLEDGTDIILHLEFQIADEQKMVYRMAEYKAIIQRKYELPVRQFVVYLGAGESKMRTQLHPEEHITGFELRNIHQMPLELVLDSDIPEEIVLSILTDFPKADAERVIERILTKLKKVSGSEADLKKSLQQLITLSRIRKLEIETKEKIKAMPITYDITTDGLYLEGIEKGIQKSKYQTIVNLLKETSLSPEQIAKIADTSVDEVLLIKQEYKN